MPSAAADLEAAYLWLAERSPEAAAAWYNGAVDAVLSLEAFPERCPLAPESDAFDHEIRQLLHGKRQHAYRILYEVTGQTVRVLHVRHGAREHLKPAKDQWGGGCVNPDLKSRPALNASGFALGNVSARGGIAAVARPVSMEELAARLVEPLVSVRSEIVPVRLQQVRGQAFAAVPIIKGERGAECRNRNAFLDCHGHRVSPRPV